MIPDGPDKDKDADGITTTSFADTADIPALEAYIMYSSDSFTAQLAGLYQSDALGDDDDFAIGGGIYWDPVSQVTLGFGATYIERSDLQSLGLVDGPDPDAIPETLAFIDEDDSDSLEVSFGTWLRFP